MAEGTKEVHFEEHIVRYLTKIPQREFSEYKLRESSDYDKTLCLIPDDLIDFIKETQPRKYEALAVQYAAAVNTKITERVADELKKRKTLNVFREK